MGFYLAIQDVHSLLASSPFMGKLQLPNGIHLFYLLFEENTGRGYPLIKLPQSSILENDLSRGHS
jgi:hypothetical protein